MRNDRQHDRSIQGSCDGELLLCQSHSNQRQRANRVYDGDCHHEHKSGDDHAFKGSAPRHRSIAIHCKPGCYMVDVVRHNQHHRFLHCTGICRHVQYQGNINCQFDQHCNSRRCRDSCELRDQEERQLRNRRADQRVGSDASQREFGQIRTDLEQHGPLDGAIWGQPLYLNGVTINGKARNAVFVTTANDSVYAFDADTGALLWKISFLSPGVTAVAGTSLQISSQIGILSTPVIDPVKQVMYVVSETSENNATTFPHRLHALSILTGKEMLGGPVLISDPALPPVQKFQRPGLLLANGRIYVAFGVHRRSQSLPRTDIRVR